MSSASPVNHQCIRPPEGFLSNKGIRDTNLKRLAHFLSRGNGVRSEGGDSCRIDNDVKNKRTTEACDNYQDGNGLITKDTQRCNCNAETPLPNVQKGCSLKDTKGGVIRKAGRSLRNQVGYYVSIPE